MDKRILILLVLVFLAGLLAGRYATPEKIKVETKTIIKTEVVKDEHKAVDTSKSITEVTRKNGTKVKHTEIRTAERLDNRALERVIEAETKKTEVEARKSLIVSLTASKSINDLFAPPVLGASVVFPIVFGLYGGAMLQMNSSVGVSLGWGF